MQERSAWTRKLRRPTVVSTDEAYIPTRRLYKLRGGGFHIGRSLFL